MEVTMQRTFCDRCGVECVNTTAHVAISVRHHMKDGKYVGEDEYKPAELCASCLKELEEFFPQAFALRFGKDDMPRDDTMIAHDPNVVAVYNEPERLGP
jgi:hypothetical protein